MAKEKDTSTARFPGMSGMTRATDLGSGRGWSVYYAMRRTVRNTASLMAGGRVSEKLGEGWAADLKTRTIMWRPTSSRPPYRMITSDEALFLTAHEAGHLIYTGEYDIRDGVTDKQEYHYWVNGSEDIRIDRLNAEEYAIYGPLCSKFSRTCIIDELGQEGLAKLSTTFQVTFGFHAIEHGFAKSYMQWLDRDVVKFIRDNWHAYSAACQKDSTDEMVEALHQMYLTLKQTLPENGGGGEAPDQDDLDAIGQFMSGLSDGDGSGAERFPYRSEAKTGNKGNPMTDGANEDADQLGNKNGRDQGVQKVKAQQQGAEQDSDRLKEQIGGQQAGTAEGHHTYDSSIKYQTYVDRNLATIRRLSHRIKTILRHNQMDAWDSGHRRGKLDVRRAPKAMQGHRNIFRKRTAIGKSLYTICLMYDISGSMGGYGDQMANVCATLMESLERGGIQVVVIPWESKPVFVKRPEEIARANNNRIGDKIVQTLARPTGGTTEIKALDALEGELQRLISQGRLGQSIVYSVTDGETNFLDASQQAIAEIRERYGIETVGIGLNFTPPAHYHHKYQIKSPDDLLVIIPETLRKLIKRG